VPRMLARLARLRHAPADDPLKSLVVAAAVCVVCSLVVSTAAVLLRPVQEAHRARERTRYIQTILQGVPGLGDVLGDVTPESLEARAVDLDSGEYADDVDPTTYDARKAAADPETSIALAKDRDPARLGRRARWATVYLVRREGRVVLVILPVHGEGFQSTLRGFVALDAGTNRIQGLSFYEQGETPGLGAEVANPDWLSQWPGRRVRDESGHVRVAVAEGAATSEYEVDGIAGATWTGKGVTNLLRFWLGPDGFGPYLARLAKENA
jgi:Na+-transporting NADH:ubiquinone oxidoreductase subunit C